METAYYQLSDGMIARVDTEGDSPYVPEDGEPLTEAEYQQLTAQLAAERAAADDAVRAQEAAARAAAYQALVDNGIPPAAATTITGHTPTVE